MNEFYHKMVLIIIDKGLLAIVVVLFSYILNRVLENYRLRNTYWQELIKLRIECNKILIRAVSEFQTDIRQRMQLGYTELALAQNKLRATVHTITPFLSPAIFSSYLHFLDDMAEVEWHNDGTRSDVLWKIVDRFYNSVSEAILQLPIELLEKRYSDIRKQTHCYRSAIKDVQYLLAKLEAEDTDVITVNDATP